MGQLPIIQVRPKEGTTVHSLLQQIEEGKVRGRSHCVFGRNGPGKKEEPGVGKEGERRW